MTESPEINPATMAPPRIRWEDGRYGSHLTGFVGNVEAFSVGYGTTRSETMYYLQSNLPGHPRARGPFGQKYTSAENAMAAAEGIWERWLARVGAIPATSTEETS